MASAYLYKDLGTPTNAYKGTVSHWVKRSGLGASTEFGSFAAWLNGGSSTRSHCNWYDDTIYFYSQQHSMVVQTNRKFRDVNAWYHTVIAWDTTQSTASDRVKIYINGVQETSFSTANYPAQNSVLEYNVSGRRFGVGCLAQSNGSAASFWNGCISDFHFIDGTQYAASDFGSTDSTTGIWKPIVSPSVTYGTNGFFLKFNNSANMGLDSSGQSNNYTTSGTIIQNKDTPSNVFAALNPLNVPASNAPTFANANNTSTTPGSGGRFGGSSTLGMSAGKYYWEAKYVISGLPRGGFGVTYDPGECARNNDTSSEYNYAWSYQSESGLIRNSGSTLDTEATYANGDIVMCALDLTNNKLYFGKNGTWLNSGDPTSGSTGTGAYSVTADKTYFTYTEDNTSGSDQQTYQFNFGNGYFGTTAVSSAQNPDDGVGIFEYDVPAGYRALCTKSLNAQEYS